MSQKPKHKIRQKARKDDDIVRSDTRTFFIRDYMIYHSQDDRWLCDCKAFVFNDKEDCKHIIRIKAEYKIN